MFSHCKIFFTAEDCLIYPPTRKDQPKKTSEKWTIILSWERVFHLFSHCGKSVANDEISTSFDVGSKKSV
jgi:hypothetical protein